MPDAHRDGEARHVQPNFGENPLCRPATDAGDGAEQDDGLLPGECRLGGRVVAVLLAESLLVSLLLRNWRYFLHVDGNFVTHPCDRFI